jgi:hypothetical protein
MSQVLVIINGLTDHPTRNLVCETPSMTNGLNLDHFWRGFQTHLEEIFTGWIQKRRICLLRPVPRVERLEKHFNMTLRCRPQSSVKTTSHRPQIDEKTIGLCFFWGQPTLCHPMARAESFFSDLKVWLWYIGSVQNCFRRLFGHSSKWTNVQSVCNYQQVDRPFHLKTCV